MSIQVPLDSASSMQGAGRRFAAAMCRQRAERAAAHAGWLAARAISISRFCMRIVPAPFSSPHTPATGAWEAASDGSRSMRVPWAALAALSALLLCLAAGSAEGRHIGDPQPAGAGGLSALVFGGAGPDHGGQPHLMKQEVPPQGQQAAGEEKRGEGEDKTIAQVRLPWAGCVAHACRTPPIPRWALLACWGGAGGAADAARGPCRPFKPAALPLPGLAADAG